QLNVIQFRSSYRRTVLRRASLISHQIRHHLESHRNLFEQINWQLHDFGQYAVDPRTNSNRVLPRLDVKITCVKPNGVLDETIHQDDYLDTLSGKFGLKILNSITHGAPRRGLCTRGD